AIAAGEYTTGALTALADDAEPVKLVPQHSGGPQVRIAPEDHTHSLGFDLVDAQLAILDVIAKWNIAAHPHALGLGGCDLVANALTGNLTLELCEGEQHVEGQPSHRCRGVELLRHRDEGG